MIWNPYDMQQYEREVFGSQPATLSNIPLMTNSNSLMMLLPPQNLSNSDFIVDGTFKHLQNYQLILYMLYVSQACHRCQLVIWRISLHHQEYVSSAILCTHRLFLKANVFVLRRDVQWLAHGDLAQPSCYVFS